MSEEKTNNNEAGLSKIENEKICAILAYFAVGILWFFVDEKLKKSEFAKFHVKQALGLIIADFLLMVALFVSIVGVFAVPLLKLLAIIMAIIGIVNAINGDKKELPLIGAYSTKYLKF